MPKLRGIFSKSSENINESIWWPVGFGLAGALGAATLGGSIAAQIPVALVSAAGGVWAGRNWSALNPLSGRADGPK